MTFAAPLQLAWLGLLAPLVVLYILRRRRERRVVGSTLLWESALRDLRAESPFRRLVPHVSLLLQALVIVLGALALARPSGAARIPEGAQVAFIVDTSLSMGAPAEGDGPRDAPIERARRYLRTRAADLPPGGRALIIAAGSSPSLLSPLTGERATLVRGAEALAVTCSVADVAAAIDLAAERLVDAPAGSEIVLLSDLAHDAGVDTRGLPVPLRVESLVPVERLAARANSGIIAADARPDTRAAGDADDAQAARDGVEIFASVAHYGATPRELYVTASALYERDLTQEGASREGTVLASQRVLVEPGAPTQLVLRATLPPDEVGRAPFLVLRLAGDTDAGDALATDDVVVLPSPGRQRLPVFMVGDVPHVVSRVFELDPDVELFRTTLERLGTRAPDAPPLDGLIVYAGELPAAPPGGPVVVVRPSGTDVFGTTLGARVPSARVTRWDESDPLLRFVTLTDVELAEIRPLASGVRALVHTSAGVAVGVLPRVDGDVTIIAADPDRGPWARSPSFVIFFRNLLDQARALRAAGGIPPAEVGAALRVLAPEGASVEVSGPGGSVASATSRAGVALIPVPPVAGVFVARVGEQARIALRHVLSAEASDLRPRASVQRGEGPDTAGTSPAPDGSAAGLDVESALYPLVALALVLALALEVAWATRRGAA